MINLCPPAPKCINRKAFLPVPNPKMPCQDYRDRQPEKTLAYAQALQYWAEKVNLPGPSERCLLARCVQELRWAMRSFTTFSDCAVLEGVMPNLGYRKHQKELSPIHAQSLQTGHNPTQDSFSIMGREDQGLARTIKEYLHQGKQSHP